MLNSLGSQLGGQCLAVFGPAVEAIRLRSLRSLFLGPLAALIVAGLAMAFRTRWGHTFVVSYATTRPGDPWHLVLLKLPLSMFAPAAMLPFWFAVVQVAVVYSLSQALVGTGRTVLVAVSGHAAATLSAHLWIVLGRPLGVAHRFDHYADAGPSAAVVALLAYLAVVRGAGWLAAGLVAYHAIEIGTFNGLSQREHLVGSLTGVCLALAGRAPAADAGSGPGTAPPGPIAFGSRTGAG